MAPEMAKLVNKATAQEKENSSNGSPSRSSTASNKNSPAKKKMSFPFVPKKTTSPVKGTTDGAKKSPSSPPKRRPSSPAAAASPQSVVNSASATTSPPTSPSKQKKDTTGGKWAKLVPGVETVTTGVTTVTTGVTDVTHAAGANWDKVIAGVKVATVVIKDAKAQKGRKLFQRDLVSAVTWEVFTPPPSNSISGKFVPRVLNKYKNRRMLSLEVHHVTPLIEEGGDSGTAKDGKGPPNPSQVHSYEECVARILHPESKELNRKLRREALLRVGKGEGTCHEYGDQSESNQFDDDDDDDATVMDSSQAGQIADHGGKHYDGWKPKYSIPISGVFIRQQEKNTVHVLFAIENVKQERDILFDTVDDAQKFCREVEDQKRLEQDRQEMRLQSSLGDIKLPILESITLLFEIVSAFDLPIGDFTTSDPYVVAMMGHQVIHRTKHIAGTLDPIWTLKTGSLFLLTVESKRLFVEDGLNFIIKDFDQFGKDEVLGVVNVNPREIYLAQGERKEFKVLPPAGSRLDEVPGYLVLRCRRASEYDQKFMSDFESLQGSKGVVSYDNPKSSTSLVKTMVTWNKKKEKDGTVKYKIRPYPDPTRSKETEWMTDDDIQAEILKPSIHWTDIGQGELGKVYVEILGCDSLPNMDTAAGGFLGNKTDAFVSLVFEDCHARTDTIDDCLSPRWLPWTNRGFIFSMAHPSSQLFIGVFDFDSSPLDDNDFIGRVSVDLSNFRRGTEYVLGYNMYPSARVSGRKVMGKITIRLRLEIPDERKLVIASLEPPPPVYVNVKKKRDFNVIRQTCLGKIDEEKYSVATLKSYIEELQKLQYVLFYVEDALMTLFLWRGHFECSVFGHKMLLPIHSFNAFVVAVFLVEHPQMFPSFCFASLGWMLMAVMGFRRNSANVWFACFSYGEILKKLVLGNSLVPPHNIEPYENIDNVNEEMDRWVRRIEDAEKKAERDSLASKLEEKERLKELEEIGDADADIGTKVGGGISIDPVRAALFPIQLMLGIVCRCVRSVKNIVIWEEVYLSFWITTGSFVLAVACMFVPWFWLIKWTSRLIVWTLFGPWMKLLDIYYFSLINPETDEERQRRENADKLKRKLATSERASKARQVRENTAKLKVMKKYMFGKFAMRIPILKQDRDLDIPLPESTATPFKEKEHSLGGVSMEEAGYHRTRVPGQTLVGDMIPAVATDTFTQAPVGKATAHPEKLAKDAPGAGVKPTMDTTTAAYVKIGSVLTAACLVSFFGTPMLVNFLNTISGKDEL